MVATSVRLRTYISVRLRKVSVRAFCVNAIKTIVLLYGFIAKCNRVNAA